MAAERDVTGASEKADTVVSARPYRSHKIPACDFCRRRKSRCDRVRLDEPCSLCRVHWRECTSRSADDTLPARPMTPRQRRARKGHRPHAALSASPLVAVATTEKVSASDDRLDQLSDHDSPQGRSPRAAEAAPNLESTVVPETNLSGHIVGPALARDAQMLEQYISPRDNVAVSHVHPNPYSVYSDDPLNPVVYMKVPRQRSRVSSGNGTPGFKQLEVIDKICEPLGPCLVDLYFEIVHPPFPILDKTAIIKAYKQGVLPHALTCEIYAVALVFWQLSDKIAATSRPPPDIRYIWNLAVSAMHEDFLSPCFSTVVACILDLLGRPITSITYNAINVGSAVALAQSLGLNRNPANWNLESPQKNLRIRTWWALLIHDYWASLCHGTPCHIHRDQWDVMLPTMDTILDGAVSETSSAVSEARRKGAQSFIGLCRLTKILGELLSTIYCLRIEPLEHVLRNLRRIETSIDDWQESLPPWLNPEHAGFERFQPGSLNLRLSFLAVKMCICRVALQTSRVNDHDEATYHQGRCVKAGNAVINFATSLSTDETRMFWLPYTAYHFASAVTLMLRCALEAHSESVGVNCVKSARKLVDFLRCMKTEADWDLSEICLGQCETTVKQMSDGGYADFWKRTGGAGRPLPYSMRDYAPRPGQDDVGRQRGDDGEGLDGGITEGPFWDKSLDDLQGQMPENFFFPELWQVTYSDFQHWH